MDSLPSRTQKKKSGSKSDHYLKNFPYNKKFMERISKFLLKNDNFILTTHVGSDPDGIGSQIGMYYLLKQLKKRVMIVNAEKVPENYRFMAPEGIFKNTESDMEELANYNLKGYTLLVLDNSEVKRLGKIKELCANYKCPMATIDHHIVKAQKNMFVDDTYAATSEIIWELYHYLNFSFDTIIATALYAGIIADTGNFRYSKTSMRTHLAGGELVEFGISSDEIYRNIYESSPPDRLKLLKRVLDKAIINSQKHYVVGFVKKSMFRKLKLGDTPTEGIVNQMLAVKGIKISALMTETPDGDLKCSLRSTGDVNVSKLAEVFGGGGHRNASGLFIKGPFKIASKKVITEIEKTLSH